MKGTGESYVGVREPIVTKSLFGKVQDILDGKLSARPLTHDFLFRRTIRCLHCNYRLIGETRKGHVYYRCHTRTCPTVSIREEKVDETIYAQLLPLGLTKSEATELKRRVVAMRADAQKHREDQAQALGLRIDVVSGRLTRLMDVYLDGAIDRSVFEEKKLALLMERKGFEENRDRILRGEQSLVNSLLEYLGRLETLPLSYLEANPAEKRKLIKSVTSDIFGTGKK
jgi:site-specific DNA recombinase